MSSSPQKILHVAGFESCGFYNKALSVLRSLAILFPTRLRVIKHEFHDRDSFKTWLMDNHNHNNDIGNGGNGVVGFRSKVSAKISSTADSTSSQAALLHSSSPFVWFGKPSSSLSLSSSLTTGSRSSGDNNDDDESTNPNVDDVDGFLGGCDDTIDWCRTFVSTLENNNGSAATTTCSSANNTATTTDSITMVDDGYTSDHGYDYDLIVIGGGSGGMAAAKEAAQLGARVACIDFVKPSPAGTTWGLGGTCVNVGCIPKKLYHTAALMNQILTHDTNAYGIHTNNNNNNNPNSSSSNGGKVVHDDSDRTKATTVQWTTLRENIRNYIRSLNFKYRVRLREKDVTYLNKLGSFIDKNTIELVDKKGKKSTLTSARFLIAVGGRPTSFGCPGSELAISSDDIFFLEKSPGKTLCVGASYISLECAGFLAGIGCDVTVAVRSIILRGFDRECCHKIEKHMTEHGVQFKKHITLSKMEKLYSSSSSSSSEDDDDNDDQYKIKVTFSDGTEDVYDTVLAAIGRQADTDKLGLENVDNGIIQINPKNQRIIGIHEQTACPNIYAVGDVLDETPELTPVAIQAGITLARRLFKTSYKQPMDYINVCTTVFTPIEYSCVGLSEEDAIAKYGAENIEVYHSEFLPLEWSLSVDRSHGHESFCKAVCLKISSAPGCSSNNDHMVLGIHYVGPNAGEVMQGFGVAMKQRGGLTYQQLIDTVGIHPTSAEEIVTLSVTKSSGEDAAAGGC